MKARVSDPHRLSALRCRDRLPLTMWVIHTVSAGAVNYSLVQLGVKSSMVYAIKAFPWYVHLKGLAMV